MSSGLGGDSTALRGLEAHSGSARALAKLDELFRLCFRQQRDDFLAEALDGLVADRRNEKPAKDASRELLDFLDRLALPVDLRLERWRGKVDTGDAAIAAFSSPSRAAAVGRGEFVFAAARFGDKSGFDLVKPFGFFLYLAVYSSGRKAWTISVQAQPDQPVRVLNVTSSTLSFTATVETIREA